MRMPEQKPLILKVSVIRVSENVASHERAELYGSSDHSSIDPLTQVAYTFRDEILQLRIEEGLAIR